MKRYYPKSTFKSAHETIDSAVDRCISEIQKSHPYAELCDVKMNKLQNSAEYEVLVIMFETVSDIIVPSSEEKNNKD